MYLRDGQGVGFDAGGHLEKKLHSGGSKLFYNGGWLGGIFLSFLPFTQFWYEFLELLKFV